MRKDLFTGVIAILLIGISVSSLKAQQQQIRLDLRDCQQDRLAVEILFSPNVSSHFIIPCNFPGQYHCFNTGSLLDDIRFTDGLNQNIEWKQAAANDFELLRTSKFLRVQYKVDDTYDHSDPRLNIFPPLGTSFEPGRCFVLNMYAIAGYMKGGTNQPVSLRIKKESFFKSPPSPFLFQTDPTTDSFYFSSYTEMTDHPIIYSYTETASLTAGNVNFRFTCLNSGFPDVAFVKRSLAGSCAALADFTNYTEVKDVNLLFYFKTAESHATNQQYGAVQHSSVGFFYFPVYNDSLRLKRELVKTLCHEFLHTYPPFTVKTDMLHSSFSEDDRTTENLWYYEGVVEYYSWWIQLRYQLISLYEFVYEMGEKMNLSDLYGKFSLTESSRKVHLEEGVDKYPNFYHKGAIAAWMLDLKIRQLSTGQQNLRTVCDRFYAERTMDVLPDTALIPSFIRASNLPLDSFFNNYFRSDAELPKQELLNAVGFSFSKTRTEQSYNLGNLVVVYDEIRRRWVIVNVWAIGLPLQAQDAILSINGETVSRMNFYELLDKASAVHGKDEVAKMQIERSGKFYEITIQPSIYIKTVNNWIRPFVQPDPETRQRQLQWRSGLTQ